MLCSRGLIRSLSFKLYSRSISSKAHLQSETSKVNLRGSLIKASSPDVPHLIWLPDILEPASNFRPFFENSGHSITQLRNVWLLDPRNFGDSDHHPSFDLHEMAEDVIRFMDDNGITMATIGGHGFGAKLATVTAINNMKRFTGVVCLEGGPVDHTYHQAYLEVKEFVNKASEIELGGLNLSQAHKALEGIVTDPKWLSIFKQNIQEGRGPLQWKSNLKSLAKNMKKNISDIAYWGPRYGLWPGQALALFAAYSRWVLLNTNTLPFYNVFPRLENQFPRLINIWGQDESPRNHWMHEYEDPKMLGKKISKWLRNIDGTHVLLADKTEAGRFYIPDRGYDLNTNTPQGEYTPEHVHYDYQRTHLYTESKEKRGVEAAAKGQYLEKGKFSDASKW